MKKWDTYWKAEYEEFREAARRALAGSKSPWSREEVLGVAWRKFNLQEPDMAVQRAIEYLDEEEYTLWSQRH